MGTKENPGEYDCYDKAEPDEPMFTLLARDPISDALVSIWAYVKARDWDGLDAVIDDLKGSTDLGGCSDEKKDEALGCAAAMCDWRVNRGNYLYDAEQSLDRFMDFVRGEDAPDHMTSDPNVVFEDVRVTMNIDAEMGLTPVDLVDSFAVAFHATQSNCSSHLTQLFWKKRPKFVRDRNKSEMILVLEAQCVWVSSQ